MYAHDLVLFLRPVEVDLQVTRFILTLFEKTSDLECNLSKCRIVPICCEDSQVQLACDLFLCLIVEFPIKYLVIPLSASKLLRSTLHPLVDQMVDRLPTWKGRLMHRRLSWIKTTLVAIPIYTAINHELPAWLLKAFVKIFNALLWTGTEVVQGRKCPWLGVESSGLYSLVASGFLV
jgi:hypothetical protein